MGKMRTTKRWYQIMLFDFVAIDFETANSNFNSACSIGIAAVSNGKIEKTEYFLIRPPSLQFNNKNIEINGITPEDVKDAPFFYEVWGKIKHYFYNNIIVAHNAIFDMTILKTCLLEYEIDMPNFTYLCSMQLCNAIHFDNCVGNSLKDKAEYFNIELPNHHNALCDAITCAKLVIALLDEIKKGNLKQTDFNNYITLYSFSNVKPQKSFQKSRRKDFKKVLISEIRPSSNNFDRSNFFYNKNVVFTGELKTLDRREAMQKVVDRGGIIKSSVSSKTDCLIVGIQDKSIVGEEGMSTKQKKAYELKAKGYNIKIIFEDEFIDLLG